MNWSISVPGPSRWHNLIVRSIALPDPVFIGMQASCRNFRGFSVEYLLPVPKSHPSDQGFYILRTTHSEWFSLWLNWNQRMARTIGRRSRGPFFCWCILGEIDRSRSRRCRELRSRNEKMARPRECGHARLFSRAVLGDALVRRHRVGLVDNSVPPRKMTPPHPPASIHLSGQPHDLAVVVDVDVFGRRSSRETGHGAHVATDGIDEPGPDRRTDLADR